MELWKYFIKFICITLNIYFSIAIFLICLAIRRPKVKEFNKQHAAASTIINQQANTIPIPTNVAINPANVANASVISQQPFNPSAPKMVYTANGSIDVNYSQLNRWVFNLQPAQQPFYAGEGQYFNNGANVQHGIPV